MSTNTTNQLPSPLANRFPDASPLGQGGMGVVYKATDGDGEAVAIKVIERNHLGTPSARRAFIREARATLRLRHPNVVAIKDFAAPAEGQAWLVTEYLAGGNLAQLCSEWPGWTTFLRAIDDVLAGLAFAHARGIIHCDIKPENILLDQVPGTAKLTDFGVARVSAHSVGNTENRSWRTEELSGTPTYMAPEQAEGNLGAIGPWTDFYSLGVVIYEMLAGVPPFDADSITGILLKHLQEEPPPLTLRTEIPDLEGIEPLLHWMLAKDPWDRPRFATHIRMEVGRLLESAGQVASDPSFDTLPLPAISGPPKADFLHDGEGVSTQEQTGEDDDGQRVRGVPPASLQSLRTRELQLVGRDEERRLLIAAAETVLADRQAHAVIIEGAPGLGKTRLAESLREYLEERGAMQSWHGSYRVEAGSPTPGLRSAVEAFYLCLGLETAQVRDALTDRLSRLGTSDPWEQQALLHWFRPEGHQPPLADATVVGLATRAIQRAAQRYPLLVWLDDAHHALDGQVLPLVERFLQDSSNEVPVLFVVTTRPVSQKEDPTGVIQKRLKSVTSSPRCDVLTLGPMDADTIAELLVEEVGLDEEAARRILQRTGGNPLLALQAARATVELSGLNRGGKHSGSAQRQSPPGQGPRGEAGEMALVADEFELGDPARPVIVSPLSSGRLLDVAVQDALSSLPDPDGARVLGLTALLGPSIAADTVLCAARSGWPQANWRDRIEVVLERATSLGLLAWDPEADLIQLDHVPLTRRLVAELELRGDAQIAHSAAAEALRQVHGDRQATALAARARHLAQAERRDDAWALMMRAVDDAVDQARYPEAAAYAAELESWFDTWETDALSPRRGQLARALTLAAIRCGAFHEASRHLEADLERPADAPAVLAERAWLRAEILAGRGEVDSALRAFEAARAAFAELDDGGGLARAQLGLARMLRIQGELLRARTQAMRAYQGFSGAEDPSGRARSLRTLGQIELMAGDLDAAEKAYEEAADVFDDIGELHGAADARRGLGGLALERGDADTALSTLRDAYRVYKTLGDLNGAAHSLRGMARARRMKAQPDVAMVKLQEAIDLFTRYGGSTGAADCLLDLASLERDQGHYDQAMAHLEQAMNAYREAGDERGVASCETTLGNVLVDAGRPEIAIPHHLNALHRFERRGHNTGVRVARLNLGHAYLLGEQFDEAVDALADVEAESKTKDPLLAATASVYLALASVSGDNRDAARSWFEKAAAGDDLTVSTELATAFERLADESIARYGLDDFALAALQQAERQLRFLGRRADMRRVSRRRHDLQHRINVEQ